MSITVDLVPGIYYFTSESGTGKTFLCELLKKLQRQGEKVDGYTYEDKENGRNLPDYLKTMDLDVVMIDRYAMYNGEFAEYIIELSERAVVLIDCKTEPLLIHDYETCFIELRDGSIGVLLL